MGIDQKTLTRRNFISGTAAATAAATLGVSAGTAAAQESADGVPSWLGEAPQITDADCVEFIDTEVLVCGAGTAGYFAACASAEAGAKTLLIDKCPMGFGIRSSALAAVGTKRQKEADSFIDKTDIINDFAHYASCRNDMSLLKLWADNSAEAIDWYVDLVESNGAFVEAETNMPKEPTRYHMWPTGHGTVLELGVNGSINGQIVVENRVMEICDAFIAEHGSSCMYNTALVCCIKDEETGAVVGIYATNENGEYIRINASKGVILATGGYAGNQEMYEALQPDLLKSLVGLLHWPMDTGDGIKAAIWAGGQLEDPTTGMLFCRGAVTKDVELGHPYDTYYEYFAFAEQPFLKVGIDGKRLCNESSPYSFVANAAAKTADRAWYPIWDSNWKSDVERFHTIGCSTLISRPGGNHDAGEVNGVEHVEEYINALVDSGYVIKADTIAELAERLGINAENLEATVARHNELFDMGYDEDFGKDAFRLSELRTPPFYGVRIGGLLLCTLQGVLTDTNHQVLDANRNPIDGLYAIGNDQGGYYSDIYPNFAAGTNAGRCATFGRLAGKHAAQK